jgi:hypothetical protein
MKTVYFFDTQTGEYLSEGIANASPLERWKYLIPVNATETAPPSVLKNQVACWNSKKWVKREDHRGEVRYSTDAATLGQEVKIDKIGTLEDVAPYSTGTQPPKDIPDGQCLDWNVSSWGFKPLPPEMRRWRIIARLSEIDTLSARPLRAIATGEKTQPDMDKLFALNAEANALRAELACV